LLNATGTQQRGQPLPFDNALVLDRVNFKYPTAETPALRGISLSIPEGLNGFIGGSGAGKSTLVDTILGCSRPIAAA